MRCHCPLFLIMCILYFLDLVFAMSALFESLEQATLLLWSTLSTNFVDRVDHNNNYICTNWLYFFVYAVVSFSPLLLKLVLFPFAFGFDIILLFNKRETKKNKIKPRLKCTILLFAYFFLTFRMC